MSPAEILRRKIFLKQQAIVLLGDKPASILVIEGEIRELEAELRQITGGPIRKDLSGGVPTIPGPASLSGGNVDGNGLDKTLPKTS